MADRRYLVGERVLVSRAADGENHEEATVVDYNERLIYEDSIPSIDADDADGERKYLTAGPNVLELPDEDEDADLDWDDEDDDEPAEADDDDVFGGGPGEETLDED